MTRARTQLRAICRTYRGEYRDRAAAYMAHRTLSQTLAHGKNTVSLTVRSTFHRRYRLVHFVEAQHVSKDLSNDE